jgi:DNA polymerase V
MPFPSPADDFEVRTFRLNDLIVHPSSTFFIRIINLSMEPTFHIGDLLIIDRALPPLDYRAVLVVYKEHYYVRRIITEDERIILRADNPSFVDIVVRPDEIDLWGVVTYSIHKDSTPTRKLPRRVK